VFGGEGGDGAFMPGAGDALQPAQQGGEQGEEQRIQHLGDASARSRGIALDGAAQAGELVGQGEWVIRDI
jgi:hypothetical protein